MKYFWTLFEHENHLGSFFPKLGYLELSPEEIDLINNIIEGYNLIIYLFILIIYWETKLGSLHLLAKHSTIDLYPHHISSFLI